MIKICKEKWAKNQDTLRANLKSDVKLNNCDYKYLVQKVVSFILNDEANLFSTERITEIDDGAYQGTLMYVIPMNTYQPGPNEYLLTYVYYGSCSGCDTLQGIQCWHKAGQPTDNQVVEFMKLCADIVASIVKPYNVGWRFDDNYNTCEGE